MIDLECFCNFDKQTFKSYVMKHNLTYNMLLCCVFSISFLTLSAQTPTSSKKINNRVKEYLELQKLGYSDNAIFQDLGNAHFLMENYDTAVFWYSKLKEMGDLEGNYTERYSYALEKIKTPSGITSNKDWVAEIEKDYEVNKTSKRTNFRKLDFLNTNTTASLETLIEQETTPKEYTTDKALLYKNAYKSPISVTKDGKTAYFSKPFYIKPKVGVLSKKQMVYKTYSAKKVNGKWTNIKEIALCPKHYSSIHPTVSDDGKRLFFASNMPGTFGKYDIYVSEINTDGSLGVAKNLGQKVNTKKNDLYPKIINGTSLFYASEGHKGYGGLDVYVSNVYKRKVSPSTNLGASINSNKDDFAIAFKDNGQGYVVSNRGTTENGLQQIAFSIKPKATEKNIYNSLEALTTHATHTNYTNSVFEDE